MAATLAFCPSAVEAWSTFAVAVVSLVTALYAACEYRRRQRSERIRLTVAILSDRYTDTIWEEFKRQFTTVQRLRAAIQQAYEHSTPFPIPRWEEKIGALVNGYESVAVHYSSQLLDRNTLFARLAMPLLYRFYGLEWAFNKFHRVGGVSSASFELAKDSLAWLRKYNQTALNQILRLPPDYDINVPS